MASVRAGKGDPCAARRVRGETVCEGLCLFQTGQRLAGEDIRPRLHEDGQPLPVERRQLRSCEAVLPAVLRSVRQIRAVGPDGSSHEGMAAGLCLIVVPRLPGDCHGEPEKMNRLSAGAALLHESGDRSLIARGGDDVRSRLEIGPVHFVDPLRRLHEGQRRPEGIVDGEACPLQLRGERAVSHREGLPGEQRLQRRPGCLRAMKNSGDGPRCFVSVIFHG